MIFKCFFEPGLSDVNNDKHIKNKALLHYFEDAASKHSDSVKSGVNDIIDVGFSWVLLEWRLKVEKRPKYGDVLEVHTWVRNSTKLYSYRDFEVLVNGERAAMGSSKWLLVDIRSLRPVKINSDLISGYDPEFENNIFGVAEFEKMKERPSYETEIPYFIRKSDIDINGHVHNLNYLDMAYELLYDGKEYDYADIVYKKEIKYGDEIKICAVKEKNGVYAKVCGAAGEVHALVELK